MEQFKRVKVVMLPHNNINTKITLYKTASGKPLNLSTNTDILSHHTNQHLYIISDDEIKEHDWVTDGVKIIQASSKLVEAQGLIGRRDWKKIIATTDTSLKYYIDGNGNKSLHELTKSGYVEFLPQPSQQFIEKYIEGYNCNNIITDVLVEYETNYKWSTSKELIERSMPELGYREVGNGFIEDGLKLKINPKDNTITIKKLKDSWNREEHINDIRRLVHLIYYSPNREVDFNTKEELDKWIEENLI